MRTTRKMESKKPIDASDIHKVCRTCLSKDDIQPIFALKHNGISVVSLLQSYFSLRVEKDDGLPQNMCSVCFRKIILTHTFQEEFRQNLGSLRKGFKSLTNQRDSDSNKTIENNTFIGSDFLKQIAAKNNELEGRQTEADVLCAVSGTSSDLLKHNMVEKPYKCALCPRSFMLCNDLVDHMMMTHAGDRQ